MMIGGDWHTNSDEAESLCHYFQSRFDRPRFHFPFPTRSSVRVFLWLRPEQSESCQGFPWPLLTPKN